MFSKNIIIQNLAYESPKQASYVLFKNMEDEFGMIFGFNLCTVPL